MRRTSIAALALVLVTGSASAEPSATRASERGRLILGYETLEMAMNRFRNFAGEVGYAFDRRRRARLTIMEVDLTERHLSSSWEAHAVDGSGVTGYLRGYELHVDHFLWHGLYAGLNLGYYQDRYEHQVSGQRIDNETLTAGAGIGYTQRELFGTPLYVNLTMPVRYYFDDIPETQLGDARVRPHLIVSNLWLFVGLEL